MINQATSPAAPISLTTKGLRWANLAFMLYLLLLAVAMVGSGFKWAIMIKPKFYLNLLPTQLQD